MKGMINENRADWPVLLINGSRDLYKQKYTKIVVGKGKKKQKSKNL